MPEELMSIEEYYEKVKSGEITRKSLLDENGDPLPPGKTGEIIKEIRTGHQHTSESLNRPIGLPWRR